MTLVPKDIQVLILDYLIYEDLTNCLEVLNIGGEYIRSRLERDFPHFDRKQKTLMENIFKNLGAFTIYKIFSQVGKYEDALYEDTDKMAKYIAENLEKNEVIKILLNFIEMGKKGFIEDWMVSIYPILDTRGFLLEFIDTGVAKFDVGFTGYILLSIVIIKDKELSNKIIEYILDKYSNNKQKLFKGFLEEARSGYREDYSGW